MSSLSFFFFFIPLLALILLLVNFIFAPHNPYQEKDSVFECGFHSFLGQNRSEFSISFFIFALLFLLFDLEILLVYPYIVSAYNNSIFGLIVMLVFFLLLTLGFAFELGKNALYIDSRQNNDNSTNKSSSSKTKSLSLFIKSRINFLGNLLVTIRSNFLQISLLMVFIGLNRCVLTLFASKFGFLGLPYITSALVLTMVFVVQNMERISNLNSMSVCMEILKKFAIILLLHSLAWLAGCLGIISFFCILLEADTWFIFSVVPACKIASANMPTPFEHGAWPFVNSDPSVPAANRIDSTPYAHRVQVRGKGRCFIKLFIPEGENTTFRFSRNELARRYEQRTLNFLTSQHIYRVSSDKVNRFLSESQFQWGFDVNGPFARGNLHISNQGAMEQERLQLMHLSKDLHEKGKIEDHALMREISTLGRVLSDSSAIRGRPDQLSACKYAEDLLARFTPALDQRLHAETVRMSLEYIAK